MATISFTGDDTVIFDDRVLSDGLSNGNVVEITYENDKATVQSGKDGNTIFAYNAAGSQITFKVRIIRGSSDDKYLNGKLAQQDANFVGLTAYTAVLVKKIGDGAGNIVNDSYSLSGGVFTRGVDVVSNPEGDAEQGTAIYQLKFAKCIRTLG